MIGDQVSEKNEIDRTRARQPNQPRQCPRHRNNSAIRKRRAPPAAQQQRHAERLVDDAWKGMRGTYGYRSQQRVQFAFAIFVDVSEHVVVQLVDTQDANALLRQLRPQLLIPTGVLFFDELVRQAVEQLPLLDHRQAVGRGGVIAVFQLLQEAADANFKKFIEIAGRDRQKFNPFQERI